jgi:PAS domain S-box-containing protein
MINKQNELVTRLQSIISTAIDGIITIDDGGHIESINQAAANQFGYIPKDVIGQNIKVLMPEPYHSEHDSYLSNYIKTKEPKIIGIGREVTGLKKDGSVFPFRLAVSEVILNDKIIFTGIIHDLTDIKNAEQRLLKLNEDLEHQVEERTNELESAINKLLLTNKQLDQNREELQVSLSKEKELNQLKSRFVSTASHEFRTPLSTILSSASLLGKYNEDGTPAMRQKHILRIKSAVNNLTGILNDFLSLSKIEEGKISVEYESVNIYQLVQSVKEEINGILKENQRIKIISDTDYTIETDKKIIKNILFNLISNAIKYSSTNTTIECTLSSIDDQISIAIADQGCGIPEGEQKFLFERFFRAKNVENIQGTGLGLHIVQRYVKLLSGSISFESQEHIGTTFTILIPSDKQTENK